MTYKKVKMKRIKKNTVLAIGDRVFNIAFQNECTLLNQLENGFLICIEDSKGHEKGITFVRNDELIDFYLKM